MLGLVYGVFMVLVIGFEEGGLVIVFWENEICVVFVVIDMVGVEVVDF